MANLNDLSGLHRSGVGMLAEGVYRIGLNILEKDYLFEGLWPIPDGTSINGYAIKAGKTALIDATQMLFDFPERYEAQLRDIGIAEGSVDYVIVNHLEPDHIGALPVIAAHHPRAQFLCTDKAVQGLHAFSGVPLNRIRAVADGETLDLGGRVVTFYHAPNLHWPETMVTYENKDKILFACDAFGSYGAVEEIFDDQLSDRKQDFYIREAERYYANIVAKFSRFVLRAIDKLSVLDIRMIAPSHGIIWRNKVSKIIQAYQRLASYAEGPAEAEVTVVWGTMYGFTRRAVNKVLEGLHKSGVVVHLYQVPIDDTGFILGSAWRSTGLVLAMPTYEYRMFPPMAHLLDDLQRKEVKHKEVLRLGSYGWSGGAQKEFDNLTADLSWNLAPSIEWQGHASDEILNRAMLEAKALGERVIQIVANKSKGKAA